MKKTNIIALTIFFVFTLTIPGCEDVLNTTAYSELTTESILNSEDGINSVLNDSYAELRGQYQFRLWNADITSGLVWSRGGSIEIDFVDYENFTWGTTHAQIVGYWGELYQAIRNANLVLENLDNSEFDSGFVAEKIAEARFLRSYGYYELYKAFGPVPLVVNPDDLILPRASDDEMKTFIEDELRAAAADLPLSADAFGRATKGSALGVLTKFYLNTKQWEKTANTAQEIIDLNQYELMDSYEEIFSFENEGNAELLWTLTYNAQGAAHFLNAITFPTNYPLPSPANAVYAAETYLFDSFIDLFEEADARLNLIVQEYTSTSGDVITLYGSDKSIPAKYPFDPNPSGPNEGSDNPIVRYSDILLSRAEALNEINGPSEDVISLINQVRERAGASAVNISGFSQQSMREFILNERYREFYFEGKSRSDQIRHGVFISNAQERGINAQQYHLLFPIPQVEVNANDEITQNEGY